MHYCDGEQQLHTVPMESNSIGRQVRSAPRALSYPAARVAAVVVTAGGLFAVSWLATRLLGAALTRDIVRLEHARCWLAVGLATTAFIAGQSAATGLVDAYLHGRLELPIELPRASSRAAARNPWAVALQTLCLWGSAAAATSFWVAPELWPHGIALPRFAWLFAALCAALAAMIVWSLTGKRFLEQVSLGPEQRRFAGSQRAYLWQRHALPQALVNAVISGWVGAALVPGTLGDVGARVSATFIRFDVVGTALVLALFVAAGAHGLARFDRAWGVVDSPPAHVPRRGSRMVIFWGGLITAIAAASMSFAGLDSEAIGVRAFLAWRMLGCGLFSGFVAFRVAAWTLDRRLD